MDINPKFTWLSPVHFDELDPMQMLHNSRFPAHVERAVSAWYFANGGTWRLDVADNPDQFHVVRELRIERRTKARDDPSREGALHRRGVSPRVARRARISAPDGDLPVVDRLRSPRRFSRRLFLRGGIVRIRRARRAGARCHRHRDG